MRRWIYLFLFLWIPVQVWAEEVKSIPHFVLGYQAFQEGRFEDVLKTLSNVASSDPLYDYVLYYRAKAFLEKQEFFQSREAFYQLLKLYPKSVWALEALKGEAEALLHLGRWIEYRRSLENYAEQSKNRKEAAWVALKVAESYALQGEWRWGIKMLKDLWLKYPETEESEEALKLVEVWHQQIEGEISFTDSEDQLERARVLTEQGQHELALKIYLNLPEVGLEVLADAFFRARHYQDAVTYYTKLYENPDLSSSPQEVLARLATSYARVENNEKAIELNLEMIRRYPETVWAAHARNKLLFLYQDSGQYKKAAEMAEGSLPSLQKQFVWNLYRAGEIEPALEALMPDDPQSLYWKSRLLRRLGRTDSHFEEQLVEKYTWDYYTLFFLETHAENQKDFRRKLASLEKERRRLPYVSVSTEYVCQTQYFHLCHASALHDLGLKEEVQNELRWVRREQDLRDETLLSFLARLAFQYEDYRTVYWVSWFLDREKEPTMESWEWHYPRAYQKVVEKWGRHYGIDPMLLYALMRQESRFDSRIMSPVGAMGLMQIMPATGIRLSRQLGLQDFEVGALSTPEMSIRLSAYYLKLLSERYKGQKALMLAAYNAGEEAVDRWLKSRQGLKMWEFIEEIPYQETYNYVQRVMRNYWIYHYLYSS